MSEQVNRLLYFKSYVSVLFQVMYEDCKEIVDTCTDNNVWLAVCHVLRYCPQARKIKQIIESGAIGDVMNIQLLEPVSIFLVFIYQHSGKSAGSTQINFLLYRYI